MQAFERVYAAMDGTAGGGAGRAGLPDRVPVVPKIWVDLAARLTGTPLLEVLRDPYTALRVIADAGPACGADAVRQFHFPRRRVEERGGRAVEVGQRGEVIGEVDLQGGLATRLADPAAKSLEDPAFIAYHTAWSSEAPFVRGAADAARIAVPGRRFYEEDGCGARQRRILESLAGRAAVLGDCGSATLAFHAALRGLDRALLDLVDEPALVHRVMEKGVAIAAEKGKFHLDLGLRVLRINDSVGNMSVISPRHWREFVFPHLKDLCGELHAWCPEARLYCHICGNVLPVAEDLVEAGLDCIGPLDPLGGFSPADARARVGDAVALMGGVNTLTLLRGTPAGVLAEARSCIRQAGGRGGYLLGSGCVVPRGTPRENLLALAEAARRHGAYRDGRLVPGGAGEGG
jgi:hypothetical protein